MMLGANPGLVPPYPVAAHTDPSASIRRAADMALTRSFVERIGRSDLAVIEVRHTAVVLERQPQPASVGHDELGLLPATERSPRKVVDERTPGQAARPLLPASQRLPAASPVME
jgi:hypothetical protein